MYYAATTYYYQYYYYYNSLTHLTSLRAIRNGMKAHPHSDRSEFPTFEGFDMNRDGLITLVEWQKYYHNQQLAEEEQQAAADEVLQQAATD